MDYWPKKEDCFYNCIAESTSVFNCSSGVTGGGEKFLKIENGRRKSYKSKKSCYAPELQEKRHILSYSTPKRRSFILHTRIIIIILHWPWNLIKFSVDLSQNTSYQLIWFSKYHHNKPKRSIHPSWIYTSKNNLDLIVFKLEGNL